MTSETAVPSSVAEAGRCCLSRAAFCCEEVRASESSVASMKRDVRGTAVVRTSLAWVGVNFSVGVGVGGKGGKEGGGFSCVLILGQAGKLRNGQ